MANLRRHFNFSTKPSPLGTQTADNPENISLQFDKHNLMNNICSYIQALNDLCVAGSHLARNLLQTVQNVPVYQNVAQQFMCTWDEVGKATAGASAAVKTETLMVLQEMLNTLEMGSSDRSGDSAASDSLQVIGSCLCSFIELQAQFSMSTWKSLSKLSKNFSNDAFIHSLNWKSHGRNNLKIARNSELCSTIKKHYSHLLHKYEMQKNSDTVEVPQGQFCMTPGVNSKLLSNSQCNSQTESVNNTPDTTVWSPSTLWSASEEVEKISVPPSPNLRNGISATSTPVGHSELDEVINLLSCMPVEQFCPMSPRPSPDHTNYDPLQSYQFWPQGGGPILSRHLGNPRSWSESSRDINFGYDSWIWRTDNLNSSELPNRLSDTDLKGNSTSSWDHKEFNRWNIGGGESSSDDTSSNHGHDIDSQSSQHLFSPARLRRYSSSDGLPETQESLPESEDHIMTVQTHKTSTWPLKQSSSRFLTGFEWPDGLPPSKCVPLYYTPTS